MAHFPLVFPPKILEHTVSNEWRRSWSLSCQQLLACPKENTAERKLTADVVILYSLSAWTWAKNCPGCHEGIQTKEQRLLSWTGRAWSPPSDCGGLRLYVSLLFNWNLSDSNILKIQFLFWRHVQGLLIPKWSKLALKLLVPYISKTSCMNSPEGQKPNKLPCSAATQPLLLQKTIW